MHALIPLVVVLAIALVLISRVSRKNSSKAELNMLAAPFYPKKLLSVPEQVLFRRLTRALPDHYVLAQVALPQIIGVKKGSERQRWLNRINLLTADFVICAPDASVVCVMELDDSSHDRPVAVSRDAKKDAALAAIGVPVIRWHVKDLPDEQRILESIPTFTRATPAPKAANGRR